jgi:hypothetical protein
MSSILPYGNRSSFNLSPAKRIVASFDDTAVQEHLLSPTPHRRRALDIYLSMDKVNALVKGPPRPPSPRRPTTRRHRYLFQGDLRNMQQENVHQRLEERRSQRRVRSPPLQGNHIQPLIA